MLGQNRLQKNSLGSLVRSGEIPSPRQTSIDETNDCAMNSKLSVLRSEHAGDFVSRSAY